jgi:hypothetical protein
MGSELQLIFNREAVMVLPPGVNKASGMQYALRKLGFSVHETVEIGDAENDHSFLERCECAVAVANAVPSGIPLADRPEYFGRLFPSLQAMRTRAGRPHWIVLDEAHHMLPVDWGHVGRALPHRLGETVLVTVHPEHVAPLTLSLIDVVIAVGPSPDRTLNSFAAATGQTVTWPAGLSHQSGHVVVWFSRSGKEPFLMRKLPGRIERIRHLRKYAEGYMRHHSFYFRGPARRHNLRAQNLVIFSQIADGIDEETWLYHLYRGDYSRWFRDAVKEPYLADDTEQIEQRKDLRPGETRDLIRSFIEARYTLPQ